MSTAKDYVIEFLMERLDTTEAALTVLQYQHKALESQTQMRGANLTRIAELIFKSDPEHFRDRKIQWIKELKDVSGCGLKEAKDAVETVQAREAYTKSDPAIQALRQKLTTNYPEYDEEPPF